MINKDLRIVITHLYLKFPYIFYVFYSVSLMTLTFHFVRLISDPLAHCLSVPYSMSHGCTSFILSQVSHKYRTGTPATGCRCRLLTAALMSGPHRGISVKAAGQRIAFFGNWMFYYRFHKNSLLVPSLSHMFRLHILSLNSPKIHLKIMIPFNLPHVQLFSGFSVLALHFLTPMPTVHPAAHLWK
jgi:hypothetical protein